MPPYLVPAPPAVAEHTSFTMAEAEFANLRNDLLAPPLLGADHAATEAEIRVRGTEVMRAGRATGEVRGKFLRPG